MLQVEPLETRSKSDNQLYEMNEASRHSGRKQPYQASHPHHKHHRRLRAQPEPPPEPEIEIEETFHTPELETPSANPNDPFEKHFLAAAAALQAQAQSHHAPESKIRSSSFRNDKQRPSVIVREAEFNSPGNYSSSPNLLFPKDDININSHNNDARDLRRVRSFKSTSKGGVINRGDSFRKRNSSRNVASGSINDSPRLASASSHPTDFVCTPKAEEPQASYFRVQVLGAPGCGKTSITNQFMSSDYANVYESMNGESMITVVFPFLARMFPEKTRGIAIALASALSSSLSCKKLTLCNVSVITEDIYIQTRSMCSSSKEQSIL